MSPSAFPDPPPTTPCPPPQTPGLMGGSPSSPGRKSKYSLSDGGSDGKESLQCRSPGFEPWVRKIPWRRKQQPTPVMSPGEPHGQRSLEGYSPRGRRHSDTTGRLSMWTDGQRPVRQGAAGRMGQGSGSFVFLRCFHFPSSRRYFQDSGRFLHFG